MLKLSRTLSYSYHLLVLGCLLFKKILVSLLMAVGYAEATAPCQRTHALSSEKLLSPSIAAILLSSRRAPKFFLLFKELFDLAISSTSLEQCSWVAPSAHVWLKHWLLPQPIGWLHFRQTGTGLTSPCLRVWFDSSDWDLTLPLLWMQIGTWPRFSSFVARCNLPEFVLLHCANLFPSIPLSSTPFFLSTLPPIGAGEAKQCFKHGFLCVTALGPWHKGFVRFRLFNCLASLNLHLQPS